MIYVDEDALICDLVETYHILNYRSHSLFFIGTLASGLRDNSRIMMRLSRQKIDFERTIMASILDVLRLQMWINTKDGQKGKNRPKSILEMLFSDEKVKDNVAFNSCEEFEMEKQRILDSLDSGEGGEINGD